MDLPLVPGTYVLDRMHTQIGFVVTHLGITPIRGMFTDFSGRLMVGDTSATSALEVAVELMSLQSSHAGREQHVQGPDFFDSANHPTMTFAATAIEGAGDTWSMEGPLTLRGNAQPIRLDAKFIGRAVFPLDGKEHVGFIARGLVSRAAFGVGPRVPSSILSDQIQLDLSVQLVPE